MATFLGDSVQNQEDNNDEIESRRESERSFKQQDNEETTVTSPNVLLNKESSNPVSQAESEHETSTTHEFDANQHPPDLFTGTFQEEQNTNVQSLETSGGSSHVFLSNSDESKFLQPEDLIKQQSSKKSGIIDESNLHSNTMTTEATGIIIDGNSTKQSLSSSENFQIQSQPVTASHESIDESHIEASEAATIAANLQGIDTQNSLYQQQPTYVLLQTGGDQENGGQPQVFLAMQTGAVTSADSQAYITLHPVSVEGQDLSGAFTAEGLNLQHAVLTQSGLSSDVSMELNQHVSLGDIKGLPLSHTIDSNSQMYLPTAGQLVAAADGTDPTNTGVITYIQPVNSLTGSQAQVLMAVAEDDSQAVRDNTQLRTKRSSSAANSNFEGEDSSEQANKSSNNSSSQSRRRLSNDPRTCDECGRSFKYPSDLKKHLQIHTDMKKFQCDACCRCFRRLHQLNVHKRIHSGEKPYVCNRCGAEFRHDSTLTMHIRTRHDHLKPFSCDGCGKNFGRMSHLRKHQRNVCGKGTPRGNIFACKYCEKSFSRKADLRQHFVTCDKKPEKPDKPDILTPATFSCEHCGKEFARNYDFKRHQLSHTDEKPFACSHCSKNFKERSSLHKHMKRMHSLLTGDNLMESSQDEAMENEAAQRAIAAIVTSSDDRMTSSTNPADIIVSLSHDMHSGSVSDNTIVTAHALAQAGFIENADQILQGSHTIAAADILNFPEVAAALGLSSTANQNSAQTMVVEQEVVPSNIITMASEHAPITDEQLNDEMETENPLEMNQSKEMKQFHTSTASLQLDSDGLIIDTNKSANQDESMTTNERSTMNIHANNDRSMIVHENEVINMDVNKEREDIADEMMKPEIRIDILKDSQIEMNVDEKISDQKDYANLTQSSVESEKEINDAPKSGDEISLQMS